MKKEPTFWRNVIKKLLLGWVTAWEHCLLLASKCFELRPDGASVRVEVYFYECYSAPKTSPDSYPFVSYVKHILSQSTKKTSNRVID